MLHSEDPEVRRVNTCDQSGQRRAWAQTYNLGCQILCFSAACFLCLLTHLFAFHGLKFKVCSPSDIAERSFTVYCQYCVKRQSP